MTDAWLPTLRRALAEPADHGAVTGARCEFCGEPLDAEPDADAGAGPALGHRHVVDVVGRSIRCSCRACGLLFTARGAGGGRLRAVGDRWAYDARFPLDATRWAALEIPVGLAFLVDDSHAGRLALFYPSPAGPTESMVAPERISATWHEALADAPAFPAPEPDTEAVVLHRPDTTMPGLGPLGGPTGPDGPTAAGPGPSPATGDGCEAFLLPVDACYRLVGRIRRSWSGFDGGPTVRSEIAGFLADARRHAGGPPAGPGTRSAGNVPAMPGMPGWR